MFFAYIIRSECGRFYIGHTEDLRKRIHQHNAGLSKWTSRYKNWKLVYSEGFVTREEARLREFQIKKYKGGNAFRKLIDSSGS